MGASVGPRARDRCVASIDCEFDRRGVWVVGRRSSVVVTVRRDASRGGVAVRGGVRRARCVGGVFARSRGVIHAQMHIVIISVVVVDDDDG